MKHNIKVTQEHINKGKRKDYSSCPIALAVKDVFPNDVIEVGQFDLTFENCDYESGNGKYLGYELPNIACNFVEDFDAGRNVKPFDFELEIT